MNKIVIDGSSSHTGYDRGSMSQMNESLGLLE